MAEGEGRFWILDFGFWIGRELWAVHTLTISDSHLFPRELAGLGDQLIGEPVTMVALQTRIMRVSSLVLRGSPVRGGVQPQPLLASN